MKKKSKQIKKKSILDETEINLKTRQGRVPFCIILIIIIIYILLISKNTSSFYNWYPGKGFDDLRQLPCK